MRTCNKISRRTQGFTSASWKHTLTGYLKNMIEARKAIHKKVIYEFTVEAIFANQLETNTAVKVYAKLPSWFTVPPPLGSYNPNWAVLIDSDEGERLYFVVETKNSLFLGDLHIPERAQIVCGKARCKSLEVREPPARYEMVTSTDELLATSMRVDQPSAKRAYNA